MSNENEVEVRKNPVRDYFEHPTIRAKFEQMLGENAKVFVTSVLQAVADNKKLKEADPNSVFMAAATAAALNLPINKQLGFAYILPYERYVGRDGNGRNQYIIEAQFQMGYRGYVQLAQRTGLMKSIDTCTVYEGDSEQDILDRLTMLMPPMPRSKNVIGFVAYFELLNGFRANVSMRDHEIRAHALEYSQAYKAAEKDTWKKKTSPWHQHYETMAKKTVIKMLLSKQAPLSIDSELTTALQADQAVIRASEDGSDNPQYDYVDNQQIEDQTAEAEEVTPVIDQLDISNNPDIFQNVLNGILDGTQDRDLILAGKSDYKLSADQIHKVKEL